MDNQTSSQSSQSKSKPPKRVTQCTVRGRCFMETTALLQVEIKDVICDQLWSKPKGLNRCHNAKIPVKTGHASHVETVDQISNHVPAAGEIILSVSGTCAFASSFETPCSMDGTALAEKAEQRRRGKVNTFAASCSDHLPSEDYRWIPSCERCWREQRGAIRAAAMYSGRIGIRNRRCNDCTRSK